MGLKEQRKLINRGKTLLNKGLTLKEIGKALHISKKRVYDLLYLSDEMALKKLEEAKREREKFMQYRDAQVWKLKAKGLGKRKIAELTGVNENTVSNILGKDPARDLRLTKAAYEREQIKRDENKKRARELRRQNLSYKQIGEKIGKSASWVMFVLGVTKRQQKWPIEKKIETVKKYKELLAEGYTTFEAEKMLGTSRAYLHLIRLEIEEEERRAFKGTAAQYKKLREEERRKFTKARRQRARRIKEDAKAEKESNAKDRVYCYAYLRVSTEEQAKEGISLDIQRKNIAEYAKEKGHVVKRWFIDDGYSGGNMNRPELQSLIESVEEGTENGIEAVIVSDSDRLARNLYVKLKLIYDVFEKNGIGLRSLSEDIDTQTPEGRFLINILGAASQFTRDKISYRGKVTSDYLWSTGEWKASGAVPLGFKMDKNNKYLEFDDKGIATLKKIYKLIKDNRGRVPGQPDYQNYEQIARTCGVGKGKVYRLARTTLREYLDRYKGFMGTG